MCLATHFRIKHVFEEFIRYGAQKHYALLIGISLISMITVIVVIVVMIYT